MATVEQIADRYHISNGAAKKLARQKARKAAKSKHTYVAPKRGVPVAGLNKKAKKT